MKRGGRSRSSGCQGKGERNFGHLKMNIDWGKKISLNGEGSGRQCPLFTILREFISTTWGTEREQKADLKTLWGEDILPPSQSS